MNPVSDEVIRVLAFLLPGFVAAAVFYSLTSHPKPSRFDRVIQALIFTVIATEIAQKLITTFAWSKDWKFLLSVLTAVGLALILVYVSNHDTIHGILRRLGITRENSYSSEWNSSFSHHEDCYVVLHLKGRRRLYGWPQEWPSRPDQGHFRIRDAEWLVEHDRIPATGVSAILIPVSEVEMVEFLKPHEESKE